MTISEKIEASGLSYTQIARECGVSVPVAWRWGKGETKPNISNISALARVLECDVRELIPAEGGE